MADEPSLAGRTGQPIRSATSRATSVTDRSGPFSTAKSSNASPSISAARVCPQPHQEFSCDPTLASTQTVLHRSRWCGDATYRSRCGEDGLTVRLHLVRCTDVAGEHKMVDATGRIVRPDGLQVLQHEVGVEAVLDRARGHVGEGVQVDPVASRFSGRRPLWTGGEARRPRAQLRYCPAPTVPVINSTDT